jgi:aryl-alcohol dehydrogenase-like predicted oxidoreductase
LSQAHASLKRLQHDRIDLQQIHGFDPATPIVETLEVLDPLVRRGDVRYLGLSNWVAWQVVKTGGIAESRRLAASRLRPRCAAWSGRSCRCCGPGDRPDGWEPAGRRLPVGQVPAGRPE